LRGDRVRAQALAKAEVDQRAGRIGRKLDAGAGLLEPFGLLPDNDAKTVAGDRQRRR
jgi:hypothetical protein